MTECSESAPQHCITSNIYIVSRCRQSSPCCWNNNGTESWSLWGFHVTVTSHERHGSSNHRQLDCYYQLVPTNNKEIQKPLSIKHLWGEYRWSMDSHHKGPVMWKIFSCHGFIVIWCHKGNNPVSYRSSGVLRYCDDRIPFRYYSKSVVFHINFFSDRETIDRKHKSVQQIRNNILMFEVWVKIMISLWLCIPMNPGIIFCAAFSDSINVHFIII